MCSIDYLFNIKGCLTKYRDLETTARWLQRAQRELSPTEFGTLIDQLDTWRKQLPFNRPLDGIYALLNKFDPGGELRRRVLDEQEAERLKEERLRKEAQEQARLARLREEALRREMEQRASAQRCAKNEVLALIRSGQYAAADDVYRNQCAHWWKRSEYDEAVRIAKRDEARKVAEQEARDLAESRETLRRSIQAILDTTDFGEADRLYWAQCSDWWAQAAYEAAKMRARFIHQFIDDYHSGSLADLDALFRNRPDGIELSTEDFIALKLPKVRERLKAIRLRLDEEQERAIARPESRLLIKARAGSGKTRTICARAVLAIRDEQLNPNQVLILAFNRVAAAKVKSQVQEIGGFADYKNARTFHSLAHRLVNPLRNPMFDDGHGDPFRREQSQFVQHTLQRILNPAFKEKMIEFFRKELEQIETIGRDLPPQEYLIFRRALQHISLKGDRVKSNGEKFIADFLFEHNIEYRYERPWAWNTPLLGGATYKPDFSIISGGNDYILEHWAIDPDDPSAKLPIHWKMAASEYRQQIRAKRHFWQSKNKPLLETHTGLMIGGRAAFEQRLRVVLERAGIPCLRLPPQEIERLVFSKDFAISRMAKLFLQFIQRAKKRGWSADELGRRIAESPDREPRARMFHKLGLRAYR